MASCGHNQPVPDSAGTSRRYLPVVDDLTAFLEIFDGAMDVRRFPTKSRLVDRCGVRNDPQLILLDINSVLVEGTLGPPHHIPHRSRVNRQYCRTQNHGQRVGAVRVSRVIQEDGELKSQGSVIPIRETTNYGPNRRHQGGQLLGYSA